MENQEQNENIQFIFTISITLTNLNLVQFRKHLILQQKTLHKKWNKFQLKIILETYRTLCYNSFNILILKMKLINRKK